MLALLGDGRQQKSGSNPERTTNRRGEAATIAGRVGKTPIGGRKQTLGYLPQPIEPPGADPHAGWCGRGRGGLTSVRVPENNELNRFPERSYGAGGGGRGTFIVHTN
jgi:hypothetical protein